MNNFQHRLKKLEGKIPASLTILIEMPDGSHIEGTVSDLARLHSQGASFKKVLSGADLKDIDAILDIICPANGVI